MIRQILTLAVIGTLVWATVGPPASPLAGRGVEIAFMLGFVLLAAYLTGTIGERFRLPRITGYIVAGIALGPAVTGLVSAGTLEGLAGFRDMALAFIGLAAGAELRLVVLRQRARSIALLIVCTTVVVFAGVAAAAILATPLIPALQGRTWFQAAAIAALIGVVATARSPSSAIAVIAETRARGPFCETLLGVTMAIDMMILPLFSVTAALTAVALQPGARFDAGFVAFLSGEIVVSVALGLGVGVLLAAYIRREGPQLAFVLLGLCFLLYKGSHEVAEIVRASHGVEVHLEPLLVCAAAGFTVQNFSRQGARLVHAMEKVSLPVYVLFFTLAGAGLNMSALSASWMAALVLVGARLVSMAAGARLACGLAEDPPVFCRYTWMGFITQAGLSIALASQLGARFGDWGRELGTLLIAAIAINQIFGPVAFKFALERARETRGTRGAARAPRAAAVEPPT